MLTGHAARHNDGKAGESHQEWQARLHIAQSGVFISGPSLTFGPTRGSRKQIRDCAWMEG